MKAYSIYKRYLIECLQNLSTTLRIRVQILDWTRVSVFARFNEQLL